MPNPFDVLSPPWHCPRVEATPLPRGGFMVTARVVDVDIFRGTGGSYPECMRRLVEVVAEGAQRAEAALQVEATRGLRDKLAVAENQLAMFKAEVERLRELREDTALTLANESTLRHRAERERDELRSQLERAGSDSERLDWVQDRRVVVMRTVNLNPEQWKVEAMGMPYINTSLRAVIDRAAEMSTEPPDPIAGYRRES